MVAIKVSLATFYTAIVVVVVATSSSFFVSTKTTATATAFVLPRTTESSLPSKRIISYNHPAFVNGIKILPNNNRFTSDSLLFFERNKKLHYHEKQQHGITGSNSTTELSAAYSGGVGFSSSNSYSVIPTDNYDGYKLYVDLDGCLVNFEKGVRTLLDTGTSDLDKRTMWEHISQVPNWFEKLEWTMDGKRLWFTALKHLEPDILTGVPDIKSSRIDKLNWCKRELGLDEQIVHHVDMAADGYEIPAVLPVIPSFVDVGMNSTTTFNANDNNAISELDDNDWDDNNHGSSLWIDDHKSVNGNVPRDDKTNVITCWSNNKYKECNRIGSILIDDRISLKDDWEDAGGIFVHHTNTETTIRKLINLGIITKDIIDCNERNWYWDDSVGSWKHWKI